MKILKKTISVFLLLIIILLAYFLRINNYNEIPPPGESADEYSFTWLGLSLLQVGKPIAGSGLAPYIPTLKYINVDGYYHRTYSPNPSAVVSPWFDHPPLFGLLTGGYAYLKGIHNFADASISLIRKPMIWIGVLNVFLLFIFVRIISDIKIAFVSALIYATEPLIVISSRMAQAENLLITFFLLSLITFHAYFKTKKDTYFWLAIVIAGVATLVKVSGWSIAISLILLTAVSNSKEKMLRSLSILLGVLLIFLLFPLYGYIYDWALFKEIFYSNTARSLGDGIGILNTFFFKQNITKTFGSGWIPLGWISLAILTYVKTRSLKKDWIILPVISYLLIYLTFGSQGYGWYKFPFFPFLIAAIGTLLIQTIKYPNIVYNYLLLFLPGSYMLYRFLDINYLASNLLYFRVTTLIIFMFMLINYIFPKKKQAKYLYLSFMSIIFLLLIGLNIYTTLHINIDTWLNMNWLQSFSF